jgi:hypothetical protein
VDFSLRNRALFKRLGSESFNELIRRMKMPSSYTEAISKDITFEDFVMRCSRAMGALIMMRDEPFDAPIPERFEPSEYYLTRVSETEARLAELRNMSDAEVEAAAIEQYRNELARKAEGISESMALKAKYEAMAEKVRAWDPPSEDHAPFKTFMIQQIYESIQIDCNIEYWNAQKPVQLAGIDWREKEIVNCIKSIDFFKSEQKKEVERTEGRNKWLHELRESLKPAEQLQS